MAKQKTIQLTPSDIRDSIAALDSIAGLPAYMGGNEMMRLRYLKERLANSLQPVDGLVSEANALVARVRASQEARRAHNKRVEQEQKDEEARLKAARDKHHAKQAEAIEQRRKREETARAAVAEVIG